MIFLERRLATTSLRIDATQGYILVFNNILILILVLAGVPGSSTAGTRTRREGRGERLALA